ncbi:hypothetical protein LIER_35884 [Lithospermum erythrorhizon]|uniref:Uncharacterized protein n=1 Tax=Lithospermum erythrorhizon TaxID=34254 RepID=A0AAV3P0E0_LITER
MAAAEQGQFILQLYDSLWFEHEIFKSNPSKITQNTSLSIPLENEKLKLSRPPSLIVRSFSEEHLSSKYELFDLEKIEPSPKSVLVVSKLQPILSGKEVQEFDDNTEPNVESFVSKNTEETEDIRTRYRGRRKKGNSKSLSELEFEELKGFMDLGFVFDNNEVKNSSLVSILPGLQRYCADNNDGKIVIAENENVVSRPYLSEAWEVMEEKQRRKDVDKKDPLVNWRIPNYGNEMEMKDHLRIWAHTVASTVR